jgi:hypothetical protein
VLVDGCGKPGKAGLGEGAESREEEDVDDEGPRKERILRYTSDKMSQSVHRTWK